jgi:hypothetical protein
VNPATAARTGELVRTLFDHLILTSSPPLPPMIAGNRAPPVVDLSTSAAPPTTTAQLDAQTAPTVVAPAAPAVAANPQAPAAPSANSTQQETSAAAPPPANLYLPLVIQSIYIEGDLNQNANLRSGPATSFPVLRVAQTGQRFVLVACNEDCTWYQLQSGEWVAAFLVGNVADPLQTLPRTSLAAAPES